MKTTIFPGPDLSLRKKSLYMWGVLAIHLLLAFQYLLVEFLFLSAPIRH